MPTGVTILHCRVRCNGVTAGTRQAGAANADYTQVENHMRMRQASYGMTSAVHTG